MDRNAGSRIAQGGRRLDVLMGSCAAPGLVRHSVGADGPSSMGIDEAVCGTRAPGRKAIQVPTSSIDAGRRHATMNVTRIVP